MCSIRLNGLNRNIEIVDEEALYRGEFHTFSDVINSHEGKQNAKYFLLRNLILDSMWGRRLCFVFVLVLVVFCR